jgi:hypothetical protein
MALGERDRPHITYHFNESAPFGYRDLMSSETFKDLSGKECHRTVARFYSKRMVDIVKDALVTKGVYE